MSRTSFIIIIVTAVVVLTVVGAVLYIMSIGFGPGPWTAAVELSKESVAGGWRVNVDDVLRDDAWDEIEVWLNDSANLAVWDIRSRDLDGGYPVTAEYGAKLLGTLSVTLTVTDKNGDGFVSFHDSFTVTSNPAFSSAVTYTAALIYEPTGERMGTGITFTG